MTRLRKEQFKSGHIMCPIKVITLILQRVKIKNHKQQTYLYVINKISLEHKEIPWCKKLIQSI